MEKIETETYLIRSARRKVDEIEEEICTFEREELDVQKPFENDLEHYKRINGRAMGGIIRPICERLKHEVMEARILKLISKRREYNK